MPRTVIDRDAVVHAALDVVDGRGPELLTMAGVAARLGVAPSALYHHVDGVAGLRAAIAVHVYDHLVDGIRNAAIGRAGRPAVVAMCEAYRLAAAERVGCYLVATTQVDPEAAPEVRRRSEALILLLTRVLESAGLEPEEAVHAARTLRSALHGFVLLESTGGFVLPQDPATTFDELVRRFVASLPGDPA